MCRYCKLIETGVTGEKTNDSVKIVMIQDGSQLFELRLWRYIDEENNDRENRLIIETAVDVQGSFYPLKSSHIDIKYCPFCGEEL